MHEECYVNFFNYTFHKFLAHLSWNLHCLPFFITKKPKTSYLTIFLKHQQTFFHWKSKNFNSLLLRTAESITKDTTPAAHNKTSYSLKKNLSYSKKKTFLMLKKHDTRIRGSYGGWISCFPSFDWDSNIRRLSVTHRSPPVAVAHAGPHAAAWGARGCIKTTSETSILLFQCMENIYH